jgi:hypothetical protein
VKNQISRNKIQDANLYFLRQMGYQLSHTAAKTKIVVFGSMCKTEGIILGKHIGIKIKHGFES